MQSRNDASVFSNASYGLTASSGFYLPAPDFLSRPGPGRPTSPSAQEVTSSGVQQVFAGLRPRPRPTAPNSGHAPSWLPPGASLSKASAAHRAYRAASAPYQRQRRSTEPRNDRSPSERAQYSIPMQSPLRCPTMQHRAIDINATNAIRHARELLNAAQEMPGSSQPQPHVSSLWTSTAYSDPKVLTLSANVVGTGGAPGGAALRPALASITNSAPNAAAWVDVKGSRTSKAVAPDSLKLPVHSAAQTESKSSRTSPILPQDDRCHPTVPEQQQIREMQHLHRGREECNVKASITRQEQQPPPQLQQQERSIPANTVRQQKQQRTRDSGPPRLAPWLLTDSYNPATAMAPAGAKKTPSVADSVMGQSWMNNVFPSPMGALLASLNVSEERLKWARSPDELLSAPGLQTAAQMDSGTAQIRSKPTHLNRPTNAPPALQHVLRDISAGRHHQNVTLHRHSHHNYQQQRQQQHQQHEQNHRPQAFPFKIMRAVTQVANGADGVRSLQGKAVTAPMLGPTDSPMLFMKGPAESRMLQSPPESGRDPSVLAIVTGFDTSTSTAPTSWLSPAQLCMKPNTAVGVHASASPSEGLNPDGKVMSQIRTLASTPAPTPQLCTSNRDISAQWASVENTMSPSPFGVHHSQQLHHSLTARSQQQGYKQRDPPPEVRHSLPERWIYPVAMANRSHWPDQHAVRAAAGGGEASSSPRPSPSPNPRGLIPPKSPRVSTAVAFSASGHQLGPSPPIPVEWLEGFEELMLILTPRSPSSAEPRPEHKSELEGLGVGERCSPRPCPLTSPMLSPRMILMMMGQEWCNEEQQQLSQPHHHNNRTRNQHQQQCNPREPDAPQDAQAKGANARCSPPPGRQRLKQGSQRRDEVLGRRQCRERVRIEGNENTHWAVSPGQTKQVQMSQRAQGACSGAQPFPSPGANTSADRLIRRNTHKVGEPGSNGACDATTVLPWTPPGVAPLGRRRVHAQEESNAKPQKSPGQRQPLLPQELAGRGMTRAHAQNHDHARSSGGGACVKQPQQRLSSDFGNVRYSSFDAAASAIAGRLLREAEQMGLAAISPSGGVCTGVIVDGAVGEGGRSRGEVGPKTASLRSPQSGEGSRADGPSVNGGAPGAAATFCPFPVPELSPVVGGTAFNADGCVPGASPRLEAVDEFLGCCAGDRSSHSQSLVGPSVSNMASSATSSSYDLVSIFQSCSAHSGTCWQGPALNPAGSTSQSHCSWMEWAAVGSTPPRQQLPTRSKAAPPPVVQHAFTGWRREVTLRRLCIRMIRVRSQRLQARVLRGWGDVVRVQQAHRQDVWATLTSIRLLRLLRKSWLVWRHAHAAGVQAIRMAVAHYARRLAARALRGWITRWAQGASVRVLCHHRAVAMMRACLTRWRDVVVCVQLEVAEDAAEEAQRLEYGREVHRALRLRNSFRAWLLLTDAALQIMSRQQALRHEMHDELLNDAALLAAADAIARHRYLAPAFHAWRALVIASASATTAPPPPFANVCSSAGELGPRITSSEDSRGQQKPHSLPPLVYTYRTGNKSQPAVSAPPPPHPQLLKPSQGDLVPWVMTGRANSEPGVAPQVLDPGAATSISAAVVAADAQLGGRRCDVSASNDNNTNKAQNSRISSDSSSRSFEFQCQLPHQAQGTAGEARVRNMEMTPQGERLRAPGLLYKSWAGRANGDSAPTTSATAGHNSSLMDCPQDLVQARGAVPDLSCSLNKSSGPTAQGSGCISTPGPSAAGFLVTGAGAANPTTPDSTPGSGSGSGSGPGRLQRHSVGDAAATTSMITPPSVHAARLVQRRSSGGGRDQPDCNGGSFGTTAAATSTDELAGGRAVLEELAPDVLLELLESDLAWYTEQYLTPPPEDRSRWSAGGSSIADVDQSLAAAPAKLAVDSYPGLRAAATSAGSMSHASLPSRQTALVDEDCIRTDKETGPGPVATTGFTAGVPAQVGTLQQPEAASQSMLARAPQLSRTSDSGWTQHGPAGRDTAGQDANGGGGVTDSVGDSWAARVESSSNPHRLLGGREPSDELRVLVPNKTIDAVKGCGIDTQTVDHGQQQPQPQRTIVSSSNAMQARALGLARGDGRLGRRLAPMGRRNNSRSIGGVVPAVQAVSSSALPFNSTGKWPPMGAYVASPVPSDDDDGYKRYVALPGQMGVLRLKGDNWQSAETTSLM